MNKLFYIILISLLCCEAKANIGISMDGKPVFVPSTTQENSMFYKCENGKGIIKITHSVSKDDINYMCNTVDETQEISINIGYVIVICCFIIAFLVIPIIELSK